MKAIPTANLSTSMDRELARQGFTPGVPGAAKAIDISGMDSLSRSMRARLPAHQRAAYNQNWAASPLANSPAAAVRSHDVIQAGAPLTLAELSAASKRANTELSAAMSRQVAKLTARGARARTP